MARNNHIDKCSKRVDGAKTKMLISKVLISLFKEGILTKLGAKLEIKISKRRDNRHFSATFLS